MGAGGSGDKMKVKSDTKVKIGNEGRVTFRNKLEETANTFGQRFLFFFLK